jgi:hypothetical protein
VREAEEFAIAFSHEGVQATKTWRS